jgi:hypothetical protein
LENFSAQTKQKAPSIKDEAVLVVPPLFAAVSSSLSANTESLPGDEPPACSMLLLVITEGNRQA